MPDHPNKPDRTLSEISHLFLSSVRERQTQGAARPQRTPPAPPAPVASAARLESVELTPDELAQVLPPLHIEPDEQTIRGAPVTAVLAAHLGGQQADRVREYVAHRCGSGAQRIGLIELDAGEFRLSCFEKTGHGASIPTTPQTSDAFDVRRMAEALEELSYEIDRWIVLLPAPRATEARTLLREIDHWTLLTTCDHDGVVASYRTLKGLADLHQNGNPKAPRPKLSLALLDAHDKAEADHVHRKLAGVCQQFLGWALEPEPPVHPRHDVTSCDVLTCRSTRDKAQLAAAPQWQVVVSFIAKLKSALAAARQRAPQHQFEANPVTTLPPASPEPTVEAILSPDSSVAAPAVTPAMRIDDGFSDVIDLPAGSADASPAAIVSAVLRSGSGMVECPIRPPMCADASVAVSRDRKLVLVAVARSGLHDLGGIGQAYRWLTENRGLVTMALPQFAIDSHQLPALHLLVDHADVSADVLQPMLQSSHVTVNAYRKLRWAGKTGLILEAA